jgi:hypothetical protein
LFLRNLSREKEEWMKGEDWKKEERRNSLSGQP